MYKSVFKELKPVTLPAYIDHGAIRNTRVLMLPFLLEDIQSLPDALSHYEQTVQELIEIAPVKEGVAYLTIDEKPVKKGDTLRKKGLHVDGLGTDDRTDLGPWAATGIQYQCKTMWNDETKRWYHSAAGIGGMLTVSSPAGCRAWCKEFKGTIGNNGDCEKLREQFPDSEATVFKAGVAYWCNSACVHESLPMDKDTCRTFVRLSMPCKAPWYRGYTKNPKGVEPTGPIISLGFYRPEEPEVILEG